jgi:hypothetical protein
MNNLLKEQFVLFIFMFFIGIILNPMNILSYNINDVYFSLTLIYIGLFMGSNMIWSHQIIHYINAKHFNKNIFLIGIILSLFFSILLKKQKFVNETQWLRRMITHHSTAITTTTRLLDNNKDIKNNKILFKLANDIINNQKKEIIIMKHILSPSHNKTSFN